MTTPALDTRTGEIVETFMPDAWRSLTTPIWEALGSDDEFIFDGLDDKTVAYLRDRIAEHPDLRTTLARAANHRRSQPKKEPRRRARYVYFIRAENGLVKIGSATEPDRRVRDLQTGSPEQLHLIAIEMGGEKRERELHRRFAHLRTHGEWFRPDVELTSYIEELAR